MKILQEKGKLKYNFYSNKQYILNSLISFIVTLIFAICFFVIWDIHFLIALILYILVWFFSAIFISYATNDIERALIKYNKDLDFNRLEMIIQSRLLNNLHSETRKELMLRYVVLLFAYDKEKAASMFATLEQPKNEIWHFLYELKKVEFFLDQNNLDVAQELFSELKSKPSNNKKILNTLDFVDKIYFQKDEFPQLLKQININLKQNKFSKATSIISLMDYYLFRGNLEEAKKIAQEFVNLDTKMHEYIKRAKNILEQ